MTLLEHPPSEGGRGLDQRIAVEVMGLCPCVHDERWFRSDVPGFEGSSMYIDDGIWRCMIHKKIAWAKNNPGAAFDYSRTIESAFLVVDKMRENGWELDHLTQLERLEGGDFVCEFSGHYSRHQGLRGRAHAPTAPLAICLAALKAVEGGRG